MARKSVFNKVPHKIVFARLFEEDYLRSNYIFLSASNSASMLTKFVCLVLEKIFCEDTWMRLTTDCFTII